MKNKIVLLFALFTISLQSTAQELTCKVKVLSEKILNTDPQIFRSLERNLTEFINSRKWTSDEFATTEKIELNILLNIIQKLDGSDDIFSGTLNIQSSRPVFNTSYTSPQINFIDRDVLFKYSQYTNLNFDDNRVSGADALESNLTAIVAYYCYLVLGFDYDSFSPNGGLPYFKKALHVVNNAPESGKSITGWKAFEDRKNRYWLIDQILSPRFQSVHSFWYAYHRDGLDKMSENPQEAIGAILGGIPVLSQVNKDNPASILLQFIFNAKSDELLRILTQAPADKRAPLIPLLSQMDVPNAAKYGALK